MAGSFALVSELRAIEDGRVPLRSGPVDLGVIADDVLLGPGLPDPGKLFVSTLIRPAPARGHEALLRLLVETLVDRAFRFESDNGWVFIGTSSHSDEALVLIEYSGSAGRDGDGETPEGVEVSMDGSDVSSGEEVALASAIAKVHGGALAVRPREGGGLGFELRLPA